MQNYIDNILNPPSKIEAGQIWFVKEIDEDVIITDARIAEDRKVIRAVLIIKATAVGDEFDINIDPEEYPDIKDILPVKKISLRTTDGPLAVSSLSVFKGITPPELLNKIKAGLKNKTSYNEIQNNIIAEYLIRLEPVREEALKVYEESLPVIFELSSHILMSEKQAFRYSLAAADRSLSEKLSEFWEKERAAKDASVILLKEADTIIRITMVDGKYYLVVITEKFKNLDKVVLDFCGKEFYGSESNVNLGKGRGFSCLQFRKNDIKDIDDIGGEGKISVTLDNQEFNFNVRIV